VKSRIALLMLACGCYRATPLDEAAILRSVRASVSTRAEPSPAAGTTGLTEDTLVREALSRSPDIAEARADVRLARAEVERATAWENPELRASFRDVDDDLVDRDRVNVGLRWNVPRFLETGSRVAAARAGIPAAEARVRDLSADVRRDVREAFNQADFARRLALLGEDLVRIRQEALVRTRESSRLGYADRLDVSVAEFAVADAVAAVRSARSELDRRLKDVSRLASLPALDEASIAWPAGEPVCLAPPSDSAGLEDNVLKQSPDVVEARAAYLQWDATVSAERLRRLPWLRWVEIEWLHTPRPNRDGVQFGLSIEIPMLDFNRGDLEEAEARRDLQTERFRAAAAGALRRLHGSLASWRSAYENVRQLRVDASTLADRLGADARSAMAAAHRQPRDSDDADAKALKVRKLYLEAVRDCRDAMIDFERAAGFVER